MGQGQSVIRGLSPDSSAAGVAGSMDGTLHSRDISDHHAEEGGGQGHGLGDDAEEWAGTTGTTTSFVLPASVLPPSDQDSHPAVYVPGRGGRQGEHSAEDVDAEGADLLEPLLSTEGGVGGGGGEGGDDSAVAYPSWQTLLLFRSLYFLVGISGSTWGRFSTVYYNKKGLTSSQIGVIEGVMPMVSGAATPIWGLVSDTTGSKKVIYCITRAINTSILMLLAVPALATGFHNLFVMSLAMSLFCSPGVVDAHVLETLGGHSKKLYGRLRMWTAVSWGAGSFMMGIVSDRFGFEYNFIAYLGFSALSIFIVGFYIPDRSRHGVGGESSAGPRTTELLAVLSRPPVFLFFLEIFVFGMAMGVIERGQLFIFVVNDLQGSTTMCGAIVGVTVLTELPIFHYAGAILDRVGHANAMLLSLGSYVVRVYGYTLLTPDTKNMIFCLEMLHGITFALMWISAVDTARLLTPQGWGTTIQSLLGALYGMLGQGMGAAVGGYVMDSYGAVVLFRGCAALVVFIMVARLIVMAVARIIQRVSGDYPRAGGAYGVDGLDRSE